MRYRRVGAAGVKVSEVSLGSWLTYGGHVADRAAEACIHRAYELGVNLFDTADVYRNGAAERVVGGALRRYPRESYVLATKVYFPVGEGPNERGLSRKHIVESFDASLQRLGTDYIDLYQCCCARSAPTSRSTRCCGGASRTRSSRCPSGWASGRSSGRPWPRAC